MSNAPQHQRSLSDVFNAFAQETVALFPHMRGKFVVFDSNTSAYFAPEIDLAALDVTSQEDFDRFIKDLAQEQKKTPTGSVNHIAYLHNDQHGSKRKEVFVVFINGEIDQKEWEESPELIKADLLRILDHEIGHYLTTDTTDNEHQKTPAGAKEESISDIYSIIRQFQRFEKEQTIDIAQHLIKHRYWEVMTSKDDSHFTAFALEELLKQRDSVDFKSLSHTDSIRFAKEFAQKHAPSEATLKALREKFYYINKLLSAGGIELCARLLADDVLDKELDPTLFRFGRATLKLLLDHEIQFSSESKPIRLKGRKWDKIRARLKEAEQERAVPPAPLKTKNKAAPQ